MAPVPDGQFLQDIDMAPNSAQIPPDFDNRVRHEFLNDALIQARSIVETFYNLITHEQFVGTAKIIMFYSHYTVRQIDSWILLKSYQKTAAEQIKVILGRNRFILFL